MLILSAISHRVQIADANLCADLGDLVKMLSDPEKFVINHLKVERCGL